MRKTRLLPVLALLAVVLGRPTPAPSEAREAPERPRKVNGPPGPYLVLVDAGRGDEFLPAAEAMAARSSELTRLASRMTTATSGSRTTTTVSFRSLRANRFARDFR